MLTKAKSNPPLIKGVRGLFINNIEKIISPLVPLFQGGNRSLLHQDL